MAALRRVQRDGEAIGQVRLGQQLPGALDLIGRNSDRRGVADKAFGDHLANGGAVPPMIRSDIC